MKLNQLLKIVKSSGKRVGRGTGSGKGKTAGRGTKGQKARGKVPQGFIGGTLPLYRRLPFRRGIGNPRRNAKTLVVPLSKFAVFNANSTINLDSLIEKKIVDENKAQKRNIKIVSGGKGKLEKALIVELPASGSAVAEIEKAGGKVVCD